MKIPFINTTEKINNLIECFEKKSDKRPLALIDGFANIGLKGLPTVAFLSIVLAIASTVRIGIPVGVTVILIIGIILSCILFHYVAFMMLPTLNKLINNAPTKISSSSLLKVLALFISIFGFLSFLLGFYYSIVFNSTESFFKGLGTFVFSGFWAFLLIQPQTLNIEIVEKTSVGEEFIGLISFLAKGCLKLTPVVFGLAIIFANILAFALIFSSDVVFEYIISLMTLCSFSFLPLAMYIAFLSYFFALDILNTILSIPAKIDQLSK